MNLKKASPLNFEKKDCDPVECPNCHQNNWRISKVTRKVTQLEHLHITCVFCDLTFCPAVEPEGEDVPKHPWPTNGPDKYET